MDSDASTARTPRWHRWIFIAALAHTLVLAAYVLPDAWVPARARAWSQAYARPLWHQQWRLFAPDPRMTSAWVEVGLSDSAWRPLDAGFADEPAMHRMAGSIARYMEDELDRGLPTPSPAIMQAMRAMVPDIVRDAPHVRFRLVRDRAVDPHHPERRERTITYLDEAP